MNKVNLLSHLNLKDEEHIQTLKKIIDLCIQCEKSHKVLCSQFLAPIYKVYITDLLRQFRDLDYIISGGYEGAEYFKLMIFPDYLQTEFSGIKVLKLTYNPSYGSVGHRDVLGALMGLGIKRHLIGDILVEDACVQILVDEDMSYYIAAQLNKVGKVNVSTELVDLDEIVYKEASFEYINYTVSSMRLDAIISSAFNISRTKASQEIKSEKVKLNHLLESSTSKLLQEKDLIAVRGRGRIIVDSILGLSKKERLKIIIKKYI